MASKFELLSNVYNDVSKDVIRSPDKWQNFLASACYNYCLRFDEQLLVFAQRPDATAVLEFDKWNRRFNRRIKRGSKGIAVFTDDNRKYIKYYFDISDTEEREKSKPVPIWQYKEEHQADVIETLENSFGELEKKDNLYNVVISMVENVVEDNIPDYFSDLIAVKNDSFLEELDDDMISSMYRLTLQNSIAFMVLTRLGIDAGEYFDRTDFQAVVNFNTPDTLNALGFATSDISQMVLADIAKTVKSLDNENRIIAEKSNADYTKAENKNMERSADYGTVRLHTSGRSSDTKSDNADAEEFDYGQIFADEEEVPQGKSQSDLLQLPNERNIAESSVGDRTQSESNGRAVDNTNGSTGRIDGGAESNQPNDLGAGNEQSEKSSAGDSNERSSLQSVTDELPPFVDKDLIPEIIKNSDDSLTHRKEFIVKRFSELNDKEKPNYVSTLYAGKTKELTIGEITVGYMQVKDGLLMYEGNYKNRTKESIFSWSVVAELMQNLIDNGEYLPKKEKEQKSKTQFSLFDFDETFVNEPDVSTDSQVSLFTDFGVSQQIIDEALCSGANEVNSRLTICAYFRRDWGLKNNTQFLKEHYEKGAFGFISEGEQVSVFFDENGIKISKGNYANRSGATLVTWEQAAKRISELLDVGRYMPQSELDKVDDFEISFVADRLVEFSRNVDEDYTNKNEILPFVNHHIKNIGGYPDKEEKVKELLKNSAYFNVIADEYADFMKALADDGYFLRFHYGREYTPEYVNVFVDSMRREPIPFKAQPDFTTPSEYYISEDEIKAIIRGGESKRSSEDRLERYSYYLEHSNSKERVKMLKEKAGWSGGADGFNDYLQDSKGFTYSHNDLFRPYAKTTMSWQQVDKYISNMITNHEYLSQDDLKLVDYYERKQAALAIHRFYFGVPKEYQRLNDYKDDEYWESVENIAEQLKNPDRAAEIQSIMTELYNTIDFEDRYKEYADKGIKAINEFADGTFTCFGDKSKTITLLIKAEKPAEKKQTEPARNTQELQLNNSTFTRQVINSKMERFNHVDYASSPEWLKEYNRLKSKYPNNLVFYQMGDFFETYADDAKVVAKHLDLVLTSRHINDTGRVVMCGFPVHNLDKNMEKLNVLGFSAVISALDNEVRKEKSYPYPIVSIDDKPQKAKEIIDDLVSDNDEVKLKFEELSENENSPVPQVELKSRVQTFDLHPEIPMSERHNYNFAEKEIETVGKKERFRRNINAINVLRDCEFDNRFATPEEQEILSGYVGWGGIPEAFDENNQAWADEFIELYTVLSPDEYEAARASTLTAFYTPQSVISAIYKVLDNLGFKQGNILEPCCAIGNFIGMLPENMQDSKMFGVEIDAISAGIAQQLYQKSSIMASPFEKAELPDSFFDAVVGNVPFGDYKLNDKRYDKNNFLIHDYFMAKSLDKLRPGGVMCLVTSKGTMDKESSNVRRYLAQRADLLGAIRLPDNTFKGNAGTRVTSDILILQKRDRMVASGSPSNRRFEGERRSDGVNELSSLDVSERYAVRDDAEPKWVQLDTDENGIKMNKYFVNHPEMTLGNMVMEQGRFKPESACKAFENADLSELLDKAVSNIKGEITEYSIDDDIADDDEEYIPADPNVRNFSYTVYDGKIYFRENSLMREVKVGVTAENRIKGMIAIRDSVRRLLEIQSENYPDDEIKAEQANLNAVYNSFVAKYGYINSRANASVFTEDSSYFLICSLEIFKEGKFERKADMFTKRTIQAHKAKTHADNSIEAFGISMGEKAKVDMEYMCQLTGKNEDEIFADLMDLIYLNPDYSENGSVPKYLTSDEYLSGNVREKLRQAKDLAEKDERFKINAAALEKVQPVDLKPNDISVHLGVTWIPIKYIEQFMYELLDTPYHLKGKIRVHYNEVADSWNIEHKSADNINLNVTQKYGTDRKNAFHIIENTLNLRNVKVFDYEENDEGKRVAILNKDETTIGQQKQKIIKQKFKDWIWRDPERRDTLCKLYNEKFNCIRPREYDGSHIVFEGMNPEITLRHNQRNAAARGIYGGNSLFAHCVGAGKTYTMAAIAQESKRLGLCSKSLFVVPNHLVSQWASEYLTLYPSANILAATKKDFETKNRKKFCARIATGDYDAIIIGHTQFEKIPLSVGRQIFNINKQIQEIIQGISDLKENNGQKFTVKALEQTKKKLESKLEKLNDQSRKDDVVTFEELGIDRVFVDEAHYYKNLYVYSKMQNVSGISQTEAQKSSDLFMKCQYLDELTGGRGVMFATGTPISNSMVELYTMQRYLQYETLRKFGYLNFDSWAAQYGETVTAMELAPEGTGYRMKTRFAKFNNLPELMSIFRMCADIQTADMLKLPVPKAVYKNISVKPSEIQSEMVSDLADRADTVRNRLVKPYEDNMLKITNDGRKLALDQRLMNPALPDFEDSKVNACVKNIYDIWENTSDKKSAQLVFCDLSTPKNKTIEMEVADGEAKMLVFQNIYDDIRTKLIEKGVPPEEIAFIHDANNDKQKADLFAKVRSGAVRVLFGSTQKMGAGTNVQKRLIAIHNIDCPWRPSDLQQREGRVVRQGNENDEVYIFSYVTENTFDAYLYQLVENKQKFIGQVMTSKTPMRSIEDIDEVALSYAEIKMLATGNPLIKEKMDLDKQVEDLKLLESNYYSERYELEDKVVKEYPQKISMYKSQIKALEIDIETAKKHLKSSADYFGGMVINGETYTEKKAAGEAIIRIMKTFKHSLQTLPVGSYRGFEMEMTLTAGLRTDYILSIKGAMTHKVELGYDIYGNITRIDNCIDHFESDLNTVINNLAETQKQLAIAQKSLKEPFEQAEELAQKQERLNELNEILCLDSKDDIGFVDEEPDDVDCVIKKQNRTVVR